LTFLFVSSWVDSVFTAGQQRALTLVNPISKAILQEATKADCDFLSRSNIMDYSYDIALAVRLSPLLYSRGFPGCCSASMKGESRSTVALWTLSAATRLRRPSSTRRRDFRGKKGRISPLSLLTSTRSALCLRWIAISWRVQVRGLVGVVCSNEALFDLGSDKWTKPVDETKLIHDPALLPSVL
jgi:hypothetical protein